MAVDALELRPRGTLALFDAAVRLSSRTLGVWALTLPAGAALVAATLHLGDAVAHHRDVLVPSALFTAAWLFRALSQGAASSYLERLLLETAEPSTSSAVMAALKRAPALIFAAGYCLALNTLIISLTLGVGFFFVGAHLAAYAVAMKGQGSLMGLYATCSKLLGPARHTASTLRWCGLSQLLVALNLHLLVTGALIVASKLLAFDVTFASRFASYDNPSWLVALAALTFALFEPIRAASATLLLIDGRVRQEGLDLLTQLEQLQPRRRPKVGIGATVVLLAVALAPAEVHADNRTEDPRVLGKRLRETVAECGLERRIDSKRLDAVDALPQSSNGALSRFVGRIERLAWDDEDCETAGDELARGLEHLEAIEPETASAEDSRDAALALLARPEFAVDPTPDDEEKPKDDEPSGFAAWWRNFWKRVFDSEMNRSNRLEPSDAGDGAALGLSGLVMVAGVALVIGVLAWLLLRSGARKSTGETATDESHVPEAPLQADPLNALSLAPERWAGIADDLARAGQFREAIRSLYLALLSRLHREGAIDYDPAKSNWDYFRAFQGPGTSLSAFKELTRHFDFAWYGNLEVSASAWQTFRSTTRPLLDSPDAETTHA